MASTVKVPIAIALLKQAEKYSIDLNSCIHCTAKQGVPGSGILFEQLSWHHYNLSLLELLNYMIVISDNTASDLVLRLVGPKAVTNLLHNSGLTHIRVDRYLREIYLTSSGLDSHVFISKSNLNIKLASVGPMRRFQAWQKFMQDQRDMATPNDMAMLLVMLDRSILLSPQNTKLLIQLMTDCQTGKNRLRGLLPCKTQVAHKTGTWSIGKDQLHHYRNVTKLYQYTNDIGLISLPHNKGKLAVAIFVKSHHINNSIREKVIAEISKNLYDYFSS